MDQLSPTTMKFQTSTNLFQLLQRNNNTYSYRGCQKIHKLQLAVDLLGGKRLIEPNPSVSRFRSFRFIHRQRIYSPRTFQCLHRDLLTFRGTTTCTQCSFWSLIWVQVWLRPKHAAWWLILSMFPQAPAILMIADLFLICQKTAVGAPHIHNPVFVNEGERLDALLISSLWF